MIQALLAYLIVAVAAASVFWSVLLPAHLRHALRQALTRRLGVSVSEPPADRCGGCRGCARLG